MPAAFVARLREWTRRAWGALTGRRTDRDLQRELAGHLACAEDELRRQGHAPAEAARLARVRAGGSTQALEALRDQRGLPGLASFWLDIKLGLRLLVRHWGLTLVGGLAMAVAMSIAAVVFAAFDGLMWSPLPIDEGDRVVAIQMWDRAAGQRRDTAWQDVELWRDELRTVGDVGAFQTIRRNVVTTDGSVELVSIAEVSAAGFRIARVPPLLGRAIIDADESPGAPPVIVIAYDVWQRRFAGAPDVIGRDVRLGAVLHRVVGVMPEGFRFPVNFRYWIPLRLETSDTLHDAGPEGVVFGRLAPDVTIARAHAEVTALGTLPTTTAREDAETTGPRVVPYTFAFTGDFDRGQLGFIWSLASLLLALLLLPPCANIAILIYARTVARQQEFAARHALGGSRVRIISQLLIESLVLAAAAGAVAVLVVRVMATVMAGRLQDIPGGPPFWMTFDVSYRTLLFVAGLSVLAAAVSGLAPAVQATGRLARLGTGALAGRTSLRLGATWTALVVAQVAFSVAVLPPAAELAWGTVRTGVIGPGFAAEEFAAAQVAPEQDRFVMDAGETPRQVSPESDADRRDHAVRFGVRQRDLAQRLLADPEIVGVAAALRSPGEEPWVFVEIEGRETPTEVLNGQLPGFRARFNQVDDAFFDVYDVPSLAGRGFAGADFAARADVAIVNRNFAETIAPGGGAIGHRFRYVRAMGGSSLDGLAGDRWYEVVGIVGNLPVTTEARVAYHPAAPGEIQPVALQLRIAGDTTGLAGRVREAAAEVDPTLHVDRVVTLAEVYRDQRFGDNLGAITIAAIVGALLLLSAAGLYALMEFTVAQRRREIGIRFALGAQPGRLVAGVFRRALRQVGAGSALGMLAAYLIGRYLPIEQLGGWPIPGILPATAVFMLFVGVAAALGPVRRGLRIDPIEALRD